MPEAPEFFYVAELTDPNTGSPFAPAVYWNGHTRPLLEPVTTTSIHEALKWRDAAACQRQIDRLDGCKRGILRPMEHAWAPVGPPEEPPRPRIVVTFPEPAGGPLPFHFYDPDTGLEVRGEIAEGGRVTGQATWRKQAEEAE
jgi:hypothetical protein